MKFLIWGTGKVSRNILAEHVAGGYLRGHSILAFVDNAKEKQGKRFLLGKEIIAPHEIYKYEFDYLLICCNNSCEKEIRVQAVEELGIKDSQIMSYGEMEKRYYKELVHTGILNAKIVVVGNQVRYRQTRFLYESCFDVCGFVDLCSLEEIHKYDFDYIVLMQLMNIEYLDRTIGRIELEKETIDYVSRVCGIKKEKILTDIALRFCRKQLQKESFGDENDDKIFLRHVITGNTSGLGAYVVKAAQGVAYAKENGYIPVIDMTGSNQYQEEWEKEKVNTWEKFFEQPGGYKLQHIEKSKNVIISHDLSGKVELDFLRMKPALEKQVSEFNSSLFKDGKCILGVLYRGSDYANRKPYGHFIQPSLEEMITKVKEKMMEWGNFDSIYLCTEVEDAVIRFLEEFPGKICFYPQKRVSGNCSEYLSEIKWNRRNDTYKRGAEYWIALEALSKCDSFIAGICNGSDIALLLNHNQYRNIYRFELGRYGIDDI